MQPEEPSFLANISPRRVIPSGSLRLDVLLGTGGIPRGHITEILGAEMAGKTTFCLHLVAEAQRLGELCAWVDADHALDPAYAQHCGVNPDRLYLVMPNNAEQALAIVESLVHSSSLALIIVDSVTSLVTQVELQTPLGEPQRTSGAALISRALPGLAHAARRAGTSLVFTSQVWPGSSPVYHHLRQHPERLALKLHSALRLQIYRAQGIGEGDGRRFQVRCVKNRLSRNFRAIRVDIVYNEKEHISGEIFDLSLAHSIIYQQRARFFYQHRDLGSSRAEAIEQLLVDQKLAARIESELRQKVVTEN